MRVARPVRRAGRGNGPDRKAGTAPRLDPYTHFPRSKRCAVAVMDVVSRKWLSTVVSAEESSTQIEVAFIRALSLEGLDELLDLALAAELGDAAEDEEERLPVLLALSDNGPQMTSHSTREFMAACAIAQHFGRPHTPNDQAWIESLFGHLKAEHPHLERLRDPDQLAAELERIQVLYNTVRLHAGIGYVTPDDEHSGRGPAIRQARRDGLAAAQAARIAHRRHQRQEPGDLQAAGLDEADV